MSRVPRPDFWSLVFKPDLRQRFNRPVGEKIAGWKDTEFTAIVFQKGSNLNISLDSVAVFAPTTSLKTVDKVQGEALLSATADLIKRRYYNLPVKVNVYAQTKELAESQAGQIRDFLGKELMAGESVIASEGFEESYARQRIDIVLLNK